MSFYFSNDIRMQICILSAVKSYIKTKSRKRKRCVFQGNIPFEKGSSWQLTTKSLKKVYLYEVIILHPIIMYLLFAHTSIITKDKFIHFDKLKLWLWTTNFDNISKKFLIFLKISVKTTVTYNFICCSSHYLMTKNEWIFFFLIKWLYVNFEALM